MRENGNKFAEIQDTRRYIAYRFSLSAAATKRHDQRYHAYDM